MSKRSLCCLLFITTFVITTRAQTSQADAERMQRQIRAMQNDPQKMMRFRDSIMNAVTHKQATQLTNGDQLLIKHHYDTGYVKVHFTYTYKSQSTSPYGSGNTTTNFSGSAMQAAKIYEANGHIIVRAMMNSRPNRQVTDMANVIDKTAKDLKNSGQYKDADKAQQERDLAAQMSFTTLGVARNKLTVTATYESTSTSDDGTSTTTGQAPVVAGFAFEYDPVQNFSTAGVGATIPTTTVPDPYHDKASQMGIGMSGTTDMSNAKIVGADPHVRRDNSDSGKTYIVVVKTRTGFKITYTKMTHNNSEPGYAFNSSEVLTATIGDDDQQYEAVIMPYRTANTRYERWLPRGPKPDHSNDNKGDDSLRFCIVVRGYPDTTKIYPGTFSVSWQLGDITHYPGFCSNYPEYSIYRNLKPDIVFSDSLKADTVNFIAAQANDTFARSKKDRGLQAIVRINCMDYGGAANLNALVTLQDGSELSARPYYQKDVAHITIPYDRDENKMADVWERKVGIFGRNYPMDWDKEDEGPANGHYGDDISLLDEYRGFAVDTNDKADVKRFDPRYKELFVTSSHATDAYMPLVIAGAKLYTLASGVQTSTIGCSHKTFAFKAKSPESPRKYDNWVNYNSPIQQHYTYAVPIYFDPGEPDHPSEANTKCIDAVPQGTGAYPPCQVDYCSIFYNHIHNMLYDYRNGFLPACDTCSGNARHLLHARTNFHLDIPVNGLSTIIAANIKLLTDRYAIACIGHEIGHATRIHHHNLEGGGDGPYTGVKTCLMRYWVDPILDENTAAECPTYLDRMIAFFSMKWDEGTGKWPDQQLIKFCSSDDDCIHQLKLKRE